MNKSINCRFLMQKLVNRLTDFLQHELDISTHGVRFVLNDVQKLKLNYFTTLINVEGSVKVMVLLSYEQALFTEIFTRYTADLSITEEEKAAAMADSAGDIINIIVGNTLADVQHEAKKIMMSPPAVITTAKQLAYQQQTKFYNATLSTDLGYLDVYLMSNTIGGDHG